MKKLIILGTGGNCLDIYDAALAINRQAGQTVYECLGLLDDNRALHGAESSGLRVLGGWTLIDAELTRTAGGAMDGMAPIGVPEFQLNANVEWDVPALPGLTVEARAVHTGEQYANAANTVTLDSWTRFDAGVRYGFEAAGRPLTLRARVENLADEDHWVAVGGYPGANYLTLGAPRTVSVSLSADF